METQNNHQTPRAPVRAVYRESGTKAIVEVIEKSTVAIEKNGTTTGKRNKYHFKCVEVIYEGFGCPMDKGEEWWAEAEEGYEHYVFTLDYNAPELSARSEHE